MNKRFFFAWFIIFVAWMFGDMVVHGVLLQADYAKLPNLFRADADTHPYMPFMFLAHIIMAGAFVWIYSRGVEAKPWMVQGVRFGFAVALLTVVPTYMIYYVVQPMPGLHVIKQIVFTSILSLVIGAVVAFMYRNPSR